MLKDLKQLGGIVLIGGLAGALVSTSGAVIKMTLDSLVVSGKAIWNIYQEL